MHIVELSSTNFCFADICILYLSRNLSDICGVITVFEGMVICGACRAFFKVQAIAPFCEKRFHGYTKIKWNFTMFLVTLHPDTTDSTNSVATEDATGVDHTDALRY